MTTMARGLHFSARTTLAFRECLDLVRRRLEAEGFRVVSEVDFRREFEKFSGLAWRNYTVLVVWSPFHAFQALISDQEYGGLFVPFNLVIAEDLESTSVAVANYALSSGLAESPIGIQVLVRELHRKMREIILEFAGREAFSECGASKHQGREPR